jgi:N-acetylmuramoyl-L-alanine amidase
MKVKVINLSKINPLRHKGEIFVSVIALAAIIFGFFFKINNDVYDAEAASATEMLIILDAGHGGEDVGATGVNGVFEKDLNLSLTFILGEMLTDKGFAVVYTRSEDKLLYKENENIKGIRKISDLKNRCKVAKNYPRALFVSIHMNTFGDSKYSGLQVYYSSNNSESEILAGAIQSSVKKELQPENNRNIKVGKDIYILENVDNPAVLIECGFLSNPEEAKKLSEKEYQKILSFSIICGIIEYMNTKN